MGSFIQLRKAGVSVGNDKVAVIDITGYRLTATRGFGANSHVVTIRRAPIDTKSVILLHFNDAPTGGDAAKDSSSYARPSTAPGGVITLDTGVYVFGPSSGLLTGGSRVVFADAAEFALGTFDFCVEGWFRPANSGTLTYLCGQADAAGSDASLSFAIRRNADKTITAFCYAAGFVGSVTSASTAEEGAFTHVAYRRKGTEFKLFIGGIGQGIATSSSSINNSPNELAVGILGSFPGNFYVGHIDEFRMRVDDFVYENDFTPTGPFSF